MHSSPDTDIDPNFKTNASVEVSYQGRLQIQMVKGTSYDSVPRPFKQRSHMRRGILSETVNFLP